MPKRTSHPGVTISKRDNGRYQIGWVPIGEKTRIWQQLETARLDVAKKEAEKKAAELTRERLLGEQRAAHADELGQWEIEACIKEWLARPNVKNATSIKDGNLIKAFRELMAEAGVRFLHDVTFEHGEILRQRIDASGSAAATKNDRLIAARGFLRWCKGKRRLKINPFEEGHLAGWQDKRKKKPIRYLPPEQRAVVWDACRSTQEKLIVALTMLIGLRNAEATHLNWGHYIRHVEPPELDVRYSEPDDDDPDGWDPKTGERTVEIYWQDARDSLELWRCETPYPTGPDDPILVNPKTGKRYDKLPRKLRERIQRALSRSFPEEKDISWSYQIGRRIAVTLAVARAEELTKRVWSIREYEAQFGHSVQVATDYYQDPLLKRIRRLEQEKGTTANPANANEADGSEADGNEKREAAVADTAGIGFSAELARLLLADLIQRHHLNPYALSKRLRASGTGPSDVAITKFLDGRTQSVPGWFWSAIETLVRQQ